MADIYDEQFKRRVGSHLLTCDPFSEDIIAAMGRYLERAIRERDTALAELAKLKLEREQQEVISGRKKIVVKYPAEKP